MRALLVSAFVVISVFPLAAQLAVPPANATPFKDTSVLKPPPHARVAIVEFEDLECGACAHAYPIVRSAMARYNIPRVHHDFLITSHVWSRDAAITARYLEDQISPAKAEEFRRDVFANQQAIASRDDLNQFTRQWFGTHNTQLPFVLDPSGRCASEVQQDCALGARLGVRHTPTIVIVTARQWIEVTDPSQLYAAIESTESEATAGPQKAQPARHN